MTHEEEPTPAEPWTELVYWPGPDGSRLAPLSAAPEEARAGLRTLFITSAGGLWQVSPTAAGGQPVATMRAAIEEGTADFGDAFLVRFEGPHARDLEDAIVTTDAYRRRARELYDQYLGLLAVLVADLVAKGMSPQDVAALVGIDYQRLYEMTS